MSVYAITDTTSAQYQLITSGAIQICDDGLLRDEYGSVGVAIGSYYADNIGDRFIITFEDGSQAKIIVVDMKADKDTINGANHITDGSMIEFVIDVKLANESYPDAITMGDFNWTAEYSGNISKIEKVIKNY